MGKPERGAWHQEARHLAKCGWTLRRIAERFGVSWQAVHYAVNDVQRERIRAAAAARHDRLYGVDDEYTDRVRERMRRYYYSKRAAEPSCATAVAAALGVQP